MVGARLKVKHDSLITIIGDEDTVTGFLLAGVGDLSGAQGKQSNFLIVTNKTPQSAVEEAFRTFTSREDASILLINQHVANTIRHLIDDYNKVVPTILEIPSKTSPYDTTKDTVMHKVARMMGKAL
uniref:V-type proton ATPase subunit F n=1 Tax=Palpitomonas bilix TaxID=652834 RepID=A0A7S3DDM8_9EUKA